MLGLIAGLIPSVIGMVTGAGQKKAARQAARQADEHFQQSLGLMNKNLDLARGNHTLARSLYGGRMAGAGAVENNIYGSQANTQAAIGRNSTSAAQNLALAGAVQANTNDAFQNLGLMETQDKARRYGDMMNASQMVQAQQGNLSNLYNQRSAQLQGNADQLGQASQVNTFNAVQGFGNTAMLAGMGAFGNPFGGGQDYYSMGTRPGAIGPTFFGQTPQINLGLPGIVNRQNIFKIQ